MSAFREYRISWLAWPHEWTESRAGERVTTDEASARDQYKGLLSMEADHELRPCGDHVWSPKLEMRIVQQDQWGEIT